MKLFYFPETVEVIANNRPNNNIAYKEIFPVGIEFNIVYTSWLPGGKSL